LLADGEFSSSPKMNSSTLSVPAAFGGACFSGWVFLSPFTKVGPLCSISTSDLDGIGTIIS